MPDCISAWRTPSKGGVHAFAVGLAREFAGAGITVAPSYTLTPELAAAIDASALTPAYTRVLDDAVALIPMGRPADPVQVQLVDEPDPYGVLIPLPSLMFT